MYALPKQLAVNMDHSKMSFKKEGDPCLATVDTEVFAGIDSPLPRHYFVFMADFENMQNIFLSN